MTCVRISAGDMSGIRHAEDTLNILDIDGDGKIGLLDFIHFAARLRNLYEVRRYSGLWVATISLFTSVYFNFTSNLIFTYNIVYQL